MSFFHELKRRNVVRVAVAYIVLAWLVLQVADVVLNNIEAPDWVFQAVMLLLAIGLPFVLIFSWAFELTPEGLKRDHEVDRSASIAPRTGRKLDRAIIVILVLAVLYFFWESRFATTEAPEKGVINITVSGEGAVTQSPSEMPAAPTPPGDAEVAAVSERSVAVLPFVNMSADPEQEYFSDGITEEIINAVVKIPGVSVPARTTVFGYKGHQGDVRAIGRELGVAHILEGSIRSQGNLVRITAQLIKVDDGFHLWSETFNRELENIFAVQEEIAVAIASQLVGEFGGEVATVPNQTRNMAAYDLYLQGRAALRRRDDAAFDPLTRATQADPNFAPAWAALAIAYQSTNVDNDLAIEMADRALDLDPNNVDALTAKGGALRAQRRWREAERLFERALAIDPNSAELLEDYAEFLAFVGRTREALEITTKGVAIDPALLPLLAAHVEALVSNGQGVRAHARASELIEKNREAHLLWYLSIPIWLDPAVRAAELRPPPRPQVNVAPGDWEDLLTAVDIYLDGSATGEDIARLKRAYSTQEDGKSLREGPVEMFRALLVEAGEIDHVLTTDLWLFDHSDYPMHEWNWSPVFSPLREQPEFAHYLERAGLIAYWDATGWPDWCRRGEAGDIKCR